MLTWGFNDLPGRESTRHRSRQVGFALLSHSLADLIAPRNECQCCCCSLNRYRGRRTDAATEMCTSRLQPFIGNELAYSSPADGQPGSEMGIFACRYLGDPRSRSPAAVLDAEPSMPVPLCLSSFHVLFSSNTFHAFVAPRGNICISAR